MYIKRQIFDSIKKNLEQNNNITAILGPRQVGKTTILNQLKESITEPSAKIFSYNLDSTEIRAKIKEQPSFILNEIERSLNTPLANFPDKIYLFIDEAQKSPQLFDFLKLLFDEHFQKIKIIISGSSSLVLLKHSTESLAGRIRFFHLYPLAIKEITNHYLNLSTESPIVSLLEGHSNLELLQNLQSQMYQQKNQFNSIWENLLLFGCLPAVIVENETTEKISYLRDFINTYIERDIRSLKEVGDIDLFSSILKSFALQDSKLLNLAKFSSDFGISRDTLRKYFSILKETFVAFSLPPFTLNNRQQTIKSQKIIFFDNGITNYFGKIDQLEQLKAFGQIGSVFENIIINNIIRQTTNLPMPPDIYFWQNYTGNEIDLIAYKNNQIIPIEITFADKISSEKQRNLAMFFSKYQNIPYGIIIYTGNLQQLTIADKKVLAVPYWLL